MINTKNIKTLTRKEIKSYLDNPSSYIIIGVFVSLLFFFFFRSVFLIGIASLQPLFGVFPWLCLVFVPAITMGLIARERKENTLEVVLAHPVSELEFVLSKFLGGLAFVAATLALSLAVPFSLRMFGQFDWGVVAGQYLGALFVSGALVSLGVFVSGVFTNQVVAFIVSALSAFFFVISGAEIITLSLPTSFAPVLENLSLLSHFASVSRGVLDLRDVFYFVSFIASFLSLAWLALLKRKLGNQAKVYRSFQTGTYLVVGIIVLINILGARIPGRLDFTQDKLYTLSPSTKKVLADLPDIVHIDVYTSKELPAQFQPRLRELKDTLRDYKTYGKGKVIVDYIYPTDSQEDTQKALSLGIQPIQFNIMSQQQFQSQQGFLGVAISYAGNSESIPFVENTNDLEYNLTSLLVHLTRENKKEIVFVEGHGEKGLYEDLTVLRGELDKAFSVRSVSPSEGEDGTKKPLEIPQTATVVVIAGPTEEIPQEDSDVLQQFLANGGAGLFLLDSINIDNSTLSVTASTNSFANFVEQYGVTVETNVIYDLQSNESVRFSTGPFSAFITPYPYWPRLLAGSESPAVAGLESVVIPWISSLNLNEEQLENAQTQVDKLLVTTASAGTKSAPAAVTPDEQLIVAPENMGEQLAAVALTTNTSRLVIVGDSDFATDGFISSHPENMSFMLNTLEWLSAEESLAGIRSKQRSASLLLFTQDSQRTTVQVQTFVLALVALGAVGISRIVRRKKLQTPRY